jgi:hypothetical protein
MAMMANTPSSEAMSASFFAFLVSVVTQCLLCRRRQGKVGS